MSKQEFWKLTKTESRLSSIKIISELVKGESFSKRMDIVFELAIQRLRNKAKIRREMQENIKSFKFTGEDFVW